LATVSPHKNKNDKDGSSQLSAEAKAGGAGEESNYDLGNWGLFNEAFGESKKG
jgi:hypothetical protein